MVLSAIRNWFSPRRSPTTSRFASRLKLENLESREVPAVLTVDGDGGKQFTTIGAAIAAAGSNDTINIYHATNGYTEQLTVNKTGLRLVGVQAGVVVKSPADVATSIVGGVDIGGALIDIRSTKAVVSNLTVDGSTNTDGELFSGIRVVGGGSATIKDNTITGLTTSSNAQYGIGVQIGSSRGTGSSGTAKVQNNTITEYLGAGVLVDGSNANGDIRDNCIVGRGAANGGVAQYGVQVSKGATARVEKNNISDNTAAGNSAGVLLFETTGRKNVVAKNDIDGNEIGIWVYDTDGNCNGRAEVINNDVTNSGFSGILIDISDNVTIKNNEVSTGSGDGIGVYDSTNIIVHNNEVSNNAGSGIYLFGGFCNEVKHNDVFCNGVDGISTEDSNNNLLWQNDTWGNGGNGVKVLGGTGNDIWLSDSYNNAEDGILLQNTTCTTVIGNLLGCNGGYGLRLENADGTLVALNIIANNGAGSIFISSDSENVCTVANRVDEPVEREAIGSAAVTASWTNSVADSDAAVTDLE